MWWYGIYSGDRFVTVGRAEEVCAELGINERRLKDMTRPSVKDVGMYATSFQLKEDDRVHAG